MNYFLSSLFRALDSEKLLMREKSHIVGFFMGLAAIVLWSTFSVFMTLGGGKLGAWQFLTCVSGIGCVAQFFIQGVVRKNLRSTVTLCPKVWLLLALFAIDAIFFTLALTGSSGDAELCNVNLIHYFWPIMCVIAAVVLIPGAHFTGRLVIAMLLASFGLLLANGSSLFKGQVGEVRSAWPYVFAVTGAMSWAIYSGLIGRWTVWMKNHTTPPMGFLLTFLASGTACVIQGKWQAMTGSDWLVAILCGLGPCGTAYMLWELALHKTRATTLGMLAAIVPILSTLLLCLVQRYFPPLELLAGAVLISMGVILSARGKPKVVGSAAQG